MIFGMKWIVSSPLSAMEFFKPLIHLISTALAGRRPSFSIRIMEHNPKEMLSKHSYQFHDSAIERALEKCQLSATQGLAIIGE